MGRNTKATKADAAATGLFSAWESEHVMTRIADIAQGAADSPDRLDVAQEKARYWFRNNRFVRRIILLQQAFYDYGFRLTPVSKADTATFTAWYQPPAGGGQKRTIDQYRRDAWQEWLVEDALVGVWRERGRPLVYPVEKCIYKDQFGIEQLTIKHELSDSFIEEMTGLTRAEKDLLKKSKSLLLTKTNPAGRIFQFDVVKRAPVGHGLGYPGLKSIFTALAATESLEVGDNLLAGVGRDVLVQWLVGHEIKSGPHAGSKVHFCTEAKAKKVVDGLKGKKGVINLVTNFDQQPSYPRPDPKVFEAKRYLGAHQQIALWAMPLAQMILERMLNPHLMPIFKLQAAQERELLAPHLTAVIHGLNPPVPVKFKWSDRCFADARLFADLLKFGYQSGVSSQQTVREEIGYDQEDELARKQTEGGLPAAQKEPAYDPAHSKPGDKAGGRAPGSPDNP